MPSALPDLVAQQVTTALVCPSTYTQRGKDWHTSLTRQRRTVLRWRVRLVCHFGPRAVYQALGKVARRSAAEDPPRSGGLLSGSQGDQPLFPHLNHHATD